VHRAAVLDRSGALADAEREASRACTELLSSHVPNAAAAFAEVGDIRRRLGDLGRAEEAFARSEELAGRPCAGTALLRLAQGRVDEASRIISGCVAELSPNRLARARVLPVAAQIAIAAGDTAAAKAVVTELDAIADAFETTELRAVSMVARGRLQVAEANPSAAVGTLHRALTLWQQLGVPYEVATTRTVLALAQRDAGDAAGAKASFASARALFEEIGVRLDEADASEPRPLPAGLTEREAEVLRLVATGLSNKDVAAQLHLSAKTVSRHVSNIFAKLGVSSRVAATAFAFAHDIADPQREVVIRKR
jgi:ATP/maltotriose-dependent transcriptional regulator MalT